MASPTTIARVFAWFETAGCKRPDALTGKDGQIAHMRRWEALLEDMDDSELEVAAGAWLDSENAERDFWPMPAAMLPYARRRGARSLPDGDTAWAHLLACLRRHGTAPPRYHDAAEAPPLVTAPRPIPGAVPTVMYIHRDPPSAERIALWRSKYGSNVRVRHEVPDEGDVWKLHDDPGTCAALEQALEAIGGWRAFRTAEGSAHDRNAGTFRRAYERARRDIIASTRAAARPVARHAGAPWTKVTPPVLPPPPLQQDPTAGLSGAEYATSASQDAHRLKKSRRNE